MSLIVFNNTSNTIEVKLSVDCFGRTILNFNNQNDIPDEVTLTSGFTEVNEHNSIEQSDFKNMCYIYHKVNDTTYILTKDEDDIYLEPETTNKNQEFISDEYIPTVGEVKKLKILNLSSVCNQKIINGIDLNINGTIEHFSYTKEDQTNIKELFDLAIQTNTPMYYHSDGNGCKLYTVGQIVELYTAQAMNKMHHITYFNQLKMYINTLENSDTVNTIEYGTELTEQFLDTYNAAMAQAELGIKTLLKAE